LNDSPELVVLFIPAEPILAAALDADPGLLEHSLGRGVALTTPSSLLALLRTCATAWARTAVNDEFGNVEETSILIAVDEILEDKRKRHIESYVDPQSLTDIPKLFFEETR